MRPAVLLSQVFLGVLVPFSAAAIPPPPEVLLKAEGGPTNVKVRRITEVRPSSSTAPPPSVALRGEHRMLVVLVETQDAPWPTTHDPGRYQEMLFAKSTASLREFYRENSYGAYDVSGEVVGPVRISGRMSDYTFQVGDANTRVLELVARAAKAAKAKSDLKKFDTHDIRGRDQADGIIDHLMLVYSEKTGGPQGFSPIWPHRGTTDVDLGNIRVSSYTVLNHGSPLGVFVHEFGHDIGLPDLYDRDYSSHGAGQWCLMGSGSWAGGGARPSHLSAWGKIRLGWIAPKIVAKSQKGIAVPSSSEKPFALKLPIGRVDSQEYFLVENRRRVGFDREIPAEGLIIWHVDDDRGDNDNEKRKMVDVVEATPIQDLDRLEQGRFPQHIPDVFVRDGKARFDDDSDPSARTYSGQPTKIRVQVLDGPGRSMNVDIDRPEIFNPGGLPFTLDRDGYRYGRFMTVPTGPGSEALVRLETTPGGYSAFGAEFFVAGRSGAKAQATVKVYAEEAHKPGKVLASAKEEVSPSTDGYSWVFARFEGNGQRLAASIPIWVGVSLDQADLAIAINPFSVSRSARFRTSKSDPLRDVFRFDKGSEPVADYVIRLRGFGFLEGDDRPEALATDADPLVMRMLAADKRADKGELDPALEEYRKVEKEMQKDARRFESWLPVLVNSIGVAAYRLQRFEQARESFETSLRRAQAAEDRAIESDIHQNLCENEFHARHYVDARRFCQRAAEINRDLVRHDRLVENHYWLARSLELGEKNDPEGKKRELGLALEAAEKAFVRERAELEEWRARIQAALSGQADDPERLPDRAEKLKAPTGGQQKAQYRDLLQFLHEDTEE